MQDVKSRKDSTNELFVQKVLSLEHGLFYNDDVEVESSVEEDVLFFENESSLAKENIKLSEKTASNSGKALSFFSDEVVSFKKSEVPVLEKEKSSLKNENVLNLTQIPVGERFSDSNKVSQEVLGNRTEETVKRFTCNQCNKSYARFHNFRKHMENHNTKLKFECDVCKRKFISAEFLKSHLAVHSVTNLEGESYNQDIHSTSNFDRKSRNQGVHSVTNSESKSNDQDSSANSKIQRNFRCKICNNSSIDYYNLCAHVKNHVNIAVLFCCQVCNKSSYQENNKEKIEKENNDNCPCEYKCNTCKIGFIHEDAIYVHHHLVHGVKLFPTMQEMVKSCVSLPKAKKMPKCEICGVTFKRNKDLNIHLAIHNNMQREKKHECSVCGKKVTSKSSLNHHMRIHTGERPWSCQICEFSSTHKSSLKIHMRTHTGEKPYECKICFKTFASKNKLNVHLRVHTREKPYICDFCKKAFWRKSDLNEHFIIHTGERPHVCDVCGKVFKYPFKLKMHYKQHTQDKQYECETCKRRFLTKHQWKEHTYTHTGEKPYVCTFGDCGKAFSRSAILGRHYLIHTGQQPYICEICKRKFNQKTSLTRHYVVHTQEKPYSCEFCDQSFTQKAYLQFHKRQKHGEDMAIK
ncbi:zinc finger protein 271-like [Parasteatoda tepidariorum]|uniref:zinc finger protein 271-like n=1 Tax=Parasteatoda tepidariorum TaxID=114398 RepID=UPI00077FC815|nr:zinc finger protein 708-like [Parasteatoda tepidariorum]